MTVIKLRKDYSEEELVKLYTPAYHPIKWPDHTLRVETTSALLSWTLDQYKCSRIADLACGDGSIVFTALENSAHDPKKVILGDISNQNIDWIKGVALDPKIKFEFLLGDIKNTINEIDRVDIMILTEILEHVNEPKELLAKISEKSKYLLLSTPDIEKVPPSNLNVEHLWSWNRDNILEMLVRAGFEIELEEKLNFRELRFPYSFQIWLARH